MYVCISINTLTLKFRGVTLLLIFLIDAILVLKMSLKLTLHPVYADVVCKAD